MLRSLICRYRNSPPNLKAWVFQILEKLSERCQVLLNWPVLLMLRPKLKGVWPESEIGGTDCQLSGPELMIPSAPAPVTKPRLESCTSGSVGWLVTVAMRVKSTRASLMADGPICLVLARTPCCTRFGVNVPKFP